jgi:hypothetical protein
MRVARFLLVGCMAVAVAGCATAPDIRSDFDHRADFAQYRTFGYMKPLGTDQAGYSTLFTERLKAATRQQLEARGYVYQASQPDLLVNFSGTLQQKLETVPNPPPPMIGYYGYRTGFYGGWPGYDWNEVYQYTEGTLNVDLVDSRRQQLVWEGVATGPVNDVSRATSAEAIEAVVKQIFARYPFRAGSSAQVAPAPAR